MLKRLLATFFCSSLLFATTAAPALADGQEPGVKAKLKTNKSQPGDDNGDDPPRRVGRPLTPQERAELNSLLEECRIDRFTNPDVGGLCAPPPSGNGPVDAQVLALSALAETPIPAPEVHMSPETNLPAIVNLQQWLWITSGWQTYTATASTGLATVTVTAVPQRVVWNMGAGTTSCADAGKPWAKGMGDATSDCGFTYQLPQTSQAVSAWVEYEASWTCSGLCSDASGTVGIVQSEPWEGNLEVRERQTVVTR